jgi:photosystem II stability/assembly factor-like uncharacterized protein
VYAGSVVGLFKSDDGGERWRPISTGLTNTDVGALAIDPATPNTLYAGTSDGGVFMSDDGGESWRAINAGLTATDVLALAIDPRGSNLYAATPSGGVFSTCVP